MTQPVVTCPDCSAGYDLAEFRKLQLIAVVTPEGTPVRRIESRTCPCVAVLAIWIDRDGDPVTDPWMA